MDQGFVETQPNEWVSIKWKEHQKGLSGPDGLPGFVSLVLGL